MAGAVSLRDRELEQAVPHSNSLRHVDLHLHFPQRERGSGVLSVLVLSPF